MKKILFEQERSVKIVQSTRIDSEKRKQEAKRRRGGVNKIFFKRMFFRLDLVVLVKNGIAMYCLLIPS